jgi:hypothetical protein
VLWGTPTADADGVAIAVPTPVKFAALQDIGMDISFTSKSLYGSKQFPLAVGRGMGSIKCKAKFANINGTMLNNIFFGQTLASGIRTDYQDLTGAAIPGTPFTITVVPPASGVWAADLGVTKADGTSFTRVAAAPAVGQYSVAAGAYLFNTGDTGTVVYISYNYTATSTTAQKQTVTNRQLGYQPTFVADLIVPYNNKVLTVKLYSCIAQKLGFATKLDDFLVPDFEFEGFEDGSGNVMDWSVTN